MHGAHVGAKDAPFFHGEVEYVEQQTDDCKERVEHGGQAKLLTEYAQGFIIKIEADEPQRDAKKKCKANALDDAPALGVF